MHIYDFPSPLYFNNELFVAFVQHFLRAQKYIIAENHHRSYKGKLNREEAVDIQKLQGKNILLAMYLLPSNHLQEDLPRECDDCESKTRVLSQDTLLSEYIRHCGMDGAHSAMCGDLVPRCAVPTKKTNYDRSLQEVFDVSSSPMLKSIKRKAEMIGVHGGGRKDKHSKVCTARGPRDRRVRLSPKTAIQFYDVQDRLGYDRPSNAIDWLISEAKAAIDALFMQQQSSLFCGGDLLSVATCGKLGVIGKVEDMSEENQVSCFSFYTDLDFNLSGNGNKAREDAALNPGSQQGLFLDTNWDVDTRLEGILAVSNEHPGDAVGEEVGYSSPGSPLLCFPEQQELGKCQAFSQTDALQSSIINYSSTDINFPLFSLSSELSNVASATIGATDLGKLSSFLQFQ